MSDLRAALRELTDALSDDNHAHLLSERTFRALQNAHGALSSAPAPDLRAEVAAVLADCKEAVRGRKKHGGPAYDFDTVSTWLTLALAGRYLQAGGSTPSAPALPPSDAICWCDTCGEPAGPACGRGHETGRKSPPPGYEREAPALPVAPEGEAVRCQSTGPVGKKQCVLHQGHAAMHMDQRGWEWKSPAPAPAEGPSDAQLAEWERETLAKIKNREEWDEVGRSMGPRYRCPPSREYPRTLALINEVRALRAAKQGGGR